MPLREDARFRVLRADAERDWRQWNPKLVQLLEKNGTLRERLDSVAEQAVRIFQQAEQSNLPQNLAQELVNEVLSLPAERTPEDEELKSLDF